MKSHQVTIKDIARELGISPSTVSRAMKDHPDISPETKKLVNDLAKKLNYEPNSIALSLRSQKTLTIGVIIPEVVHFFFSTVISGIEEIAYKAGYTVMFCQSNESYEKEVIDTKALLSHRVDGLLVSHARESNNFEHFKEVTDRNIPIVLFDRIVKEMQVSKVIVDDYEGSKKATGHLIEQGCTRIAHLAGPGNLQISKDRLNGYRNTLMEAGMTPKEEYVVNCGHGTREEGYQCMKQLLDLPSPPDAVFANNDIAAYGAMIAIKESGLRIPQDIAVVGFSNWQFSSLIDPELSTVSQPGFEMGRAAARLLLQELKNKGEDIMHSTHVLPADLIIRGSSLRK